MINKSINYLVTATVDSLKNFKIKLTNHYVAIFAMVFGSTFAAFNAAKAANGQAVTLAQGTPLTVQTTNVTQSDLTLQTDQNTANTFAINAASNYAIDLIATSDSQAVAAIINVSGGVLTIDETFTMLGNTSAAAYVTNIAAGSGIILGGNAVEGNNSTMTVSINGGTFTANKATAQALAFNFDSDVGADGDINVLAAGVKTFAGTVGATNGLDTITVGSATDDAGAIFNLTVKATTINVQSGEANNENSEVTFNEDVTGAITLSTGADAGSDAIANFAASVAGVGASGAITTSAATGNQSFINIVDSATGAAAIQTFTGQIGTSAKKIGTISVGAVGGNAGLATFNENVFATNLKISADDGGNEISSVVFVKSFTGTAITLHDDTVLSSMVVSGANTTITGTINASAGDGQGTLKITGAGTTIAGVVGTTASRSLLAVDVNATSTFSSASEATAYTIDADTTFTGAVTANTGTTIATNNTDVIYNGASSLGATSLAAATTVVANDTAATVALTLAAGSSFTANGVLTTTGDVTNTSGTLNLNVASNVIDHLKLVGTSVLNIDKSLAAGANINTSGTIDGAGSFVSTAKINLPTNIGSGDTLLITDSGEFDAAGGTNTALTTATAIDLILQDTLLTDYSASAVNADATVITITGADKSDAVIAKALKVGVNEAKSVLGARQAVSAAQRNSTDAAAYTAFDNALKGLNGVSTNVVTDLAKQVAPQIDTTAGSTHATRAMTGTVQGIVSNRMASLRSGDAYVTGVSAGNGMSANSGFIQAFGSQGEQKNRTKSGAKVFGFDSETSGLAIGFDALTDNGSTIGLSVSYSKTDIDGKGTGKSKNAIDSHTVSVYADKSTENGYIEGSLTYGINDNANSRIVNVGGLNRAYAGKYDSEQLSLKIGGGIPNEVTDNTFVTPFMSATATNMAADSYVETSTTATDALRLKVTQDDISSLVGSVGVKAHVVTDAGTPMISLSVNNEFGDSKLNTQNIYQGGGTKFTTTTDVEALSATLGLGYSFGNDVTSINLNYEVNANEEEYVNQYGSVKIVAKF